jgi:opacity protein-like surface antigen
MRKVVLSLLLLSAAGTARAADLDYDYLRGADYDPPPVATVDWSGVYVGGHGGYSEHSFSQKYAASAFAASFPSTANYIIVNTPVSDRRASGPSYGVYAGYNLQFDEAVIGIEADFTHSESRTFARNFVGVTQINPQLIYGTTRSGISDYGTVRARAGYAIGNALPFITAGVAIGQSILTHSLYLDQEPALPYLQRVTKRTVAGFAGGFGLDYAITPNILLRGEYQYINFENNSARFDQVSTIRGGAAVKF